MLVGGSRRDFPSTSWNLIRGVGKAHREHLERLIYLYWKPAYLYLRSSGRRMGEVLPVEDQNPQAVTRDA